MISTVAPTRAGQALALAAWLERHSADLYLSTITVVEIESGIARLRRLGSDRRADALTEWLEALLHLYGERVLALDTVAARRAGALTDLARAKGGSPSIAATARAHSLTLLTRNTRHFAGLGVESVDPMEALPP